MLQLPARDVREPSSPKEKLFRDKHAVFPKIRAQTIAKNWDLVKGTLVITAPHVWITESVVVLSLSLIHI